MFEFFAWKVRKTPNRPVTTQFMAYAQGLLVPQNNPYSVFHPTVHIPSYGAPNLVTTDFAMCTCGRFCLNEASVAPETHLNRRGMVDLGG